MGKKVYTIDGQMYIIDDETGDILTIDVTNKPVPPEILKKLIKVLSQNQKDE